MIWLALTSLALAQGEYAPEVLEYGDNLSLIHDATPDARETAVHIRFLSGAADESDTDRGVTHLLEHLWFRSTTSTGAEQTEQILAHGCRFNGFTTAEHVEWMLRCPAAHEDFVVDEAIRMLTDPLVGVTGHHVALERAIIAQEHDVRHAGYDIQWREMISRTVPGETGPLDRLAVATEVVEELDLATVRRRQETLREARTLVSFSGHIDVPHLEKRLRDAIGPSRLAILGLLPEEEELPTARDLIAPRKPDHAPIAARTPYPILWLAFAYPAPVSGSFHLSFLADKVESLLQRTLIAVPLTAPDHPFARYAPGYISCFDFEDDEHPMLVCQLALQKTSHSREVKSRALDILDRSLVGQVPADWADEMASARTAWTDGFEDRLSSPAFRARYALERVQEGYEPEPPTMAKNAASRRSDKRALTALSTFLHSRRASILVVKPEPADVATTARSMPAPMPSTPSPDFTPIHRPLDQPRIATRELPNGLRLVVAQDALVEDVMTTLRLPGGALTEPVGLFQEAYVRWIVDAPLPRDSRMGHNADEDHQFVWVKGPSRSLRSQLKSLRTAVRNIAFLPQDDPLLTHHRTIARHRLHYDESFEAAQMDEGVQRDVVQQLLPDAPWADAHRSTWAESRAQLSDDQMAELTRAVFRPEVADVVISVPLDLSVDVVADDAAQILAAWHDTPQNEAPFVPRALPLPEHQDVAWFDPTERVDHVAWGCRLPDHTSDDVVDALEARLARDAFLVLRARAGHIYTPSVEAARYPGGAVTLNMQLSTHRDNGRILGRAWSRHVKNLRLGPSDITWGRNQSYQRMTALMDAPFGTQPLLFEALDRTGEADPEKLQQAHLAALTPATLTSAWKTCKAHQALAISGRQQEPEPQEAPMEDVRTADATNAQSEEP